MSVIMNLNEELNDLSYVSSAPDFIDIPEVNPKDEADFSALEEIMQVLAARKRIYVSVESIVLPVSEEGLSMEQQLTVNKKVAFHIQELENLITGVVKKVKEKQNYGR